MDILVVVFEWTIILFFVIMSIVRFIGDGIASKKEGRDRNKKYTVMFIISMAIIGVVVVIGIHLFILAALFMRGM